MRIARSFEAADAFIHVPAERTDDADIIVVPHVAIGHDIEAGFFLIAHHCGNSIVVSLFMRDLFKRDANVAAEQLLFVPGRPRIGPDHRGRKYGVDDLFCHFQCSLN